MADLSSQNSLKCNWVVNIDTNLTTITIKDGADLVLGSLVIENNRCRTFLESLVFVAKEYFPDTDTTLQGGKTEINIYTGNTVLEFG